MIRWLLRWPAQVGLTLALVGAAVMISLAMFASYRSAAADDAKRGTQALLEQIVNAEARRLVALSEVDDGLGTQRLVTGLAMHPQVIEAWWVDASGTVRGSLRRSDLGHPLEQALRRTDAPGPLVRQALAIALGDEGHAPASDLEHLLVGSPMRLPIGLGGDGHLLVLGTGEQDFAVARSRGIERFGVQLIAIGAIATFLWVLLERGWARRSRALQSYASSLHLAPAAPPASLAGGDEIADVARALERAGKAWHADARLLRMIGDIGRSALRQAEIGALLQAVVRSMVEVGGFRGAQAFDVDEAQLTLERRHAAGTIDAALPDRFRLDDATAPPDAITPLLRARVVACLDRRTVLLPLATGQDFFGMLALADHDDIDLADGRMRERLAALAHDISLAIAHRRAEARAAKARDELAAAVAATQLGVWRRDFDGDGIEVNAECSTMVGRSPRNRLAVAEWRSWVHPDDVAALDAALQALGTPGEDDLSIELRLQHALGHWLWVHLRGHVRQRHPDGRPQLLSGVMLDISARRDADASRWLAAAIVDNTREGILVCNADGVILSVNRAFETLTGHAAADVVGHRASVLSSGLQGRDFYAALWGDLIQKGRWEGEIWNRRKNGEVYPEWLSITRIPGGSADGACYVGQFSDMSERKDTQHRLDLLSRTDPLTGLDNRQALLQGMEGTLAPSGSMSVLCINLDGFRQVNQSLGMQAGDQVLRAVAERLRQSAGTDALIGRLEGDIFAVAIPGADAAAAARRAEAIYAAFRVPIEAGGTSLVLGLSMGLAAAPEHADAADVLLVAARSAIHEAHESGRNTVTLYEPGRSAASRERLTLESQLRLGVESGELFVVFQPQVHLDDGRLVGIEALVRWRHPTRGVMAPGSFISIAEDSGLIVPLGEFVLREACLCAVRLQAAGFPAVPLSVNVSALQFRRDRFLPGVLAALRASGLPAALLELELTESVLMRGTEDMLARMRLVREQGMRIAIDDFGTGFSSLSYLSRMGLDRLKIDQAFVRDMRQSARAEGIVKAIVAMAKHLQLEVIAEGVEDAEDAAHLRAIGCDEAQGYLYGRPMDEAALLAWARNAGHTRE
jgi:diguanylate cyclase (GGDEF)-like protein/PAS domain S-box-containing protein